MSRALRIGAALLALAIGCTAHAGSFTATPVKLTVPAGASSTSLSLQNAGDQPVLVQAELMAWSQQNGQDVLTPSQDLVVSPPIFTVAPGAVQIVRVGLLRRPDTNREITYRLFLQEVPPPPPPGEQGISVALRLGLPVFVLPKGGAAPHLAWRARVEQGELRLSLTNSGNGHVQAIECKLYGEDGKLVAQGPLGAYVLAGQTRSWTLGLDRAWRGGKVRIIAQTGGGDITTQIVVE